MHCKMVKCGDGVEDLFIFEIKDSFFLFDSFLYNNDGRPTIFFSFDL